jgi:hypothetical protein
VSTVLEEDEGMDEDQDQASSGGFVYPGTETVENSFRDKKHFSLQDEELE